MVCCNRCEAEYAPNSSTETELLSEACNRHTLYGMLIGPSFYHEKAAMYNRSSFSEVRKE